MRRLGCLLLAVASLTAACTTDDGLVATITDADAMPVPTEASDGVTATALNGELVADTCPFEVPEGTSPDCFRLIVPSAWIDPVSSPVSMQVAVFPAVDPPSADEDDGTVLWLEGGPGGAPLEFLSSWFDTTFSAMNERFDVVVFDPRGVGFSLPNLDCAEFDDLYLLDGITLVDQADALRDCSNRLAGDEIDVADYDSLSTARDLEALRSALEVSTWHLVGQSYGTRLAQTYVREFPTAVSSMILDGAYSTGDEPDDDFAGAAPALERLVAACTADAACADGFPDFGARLGELFAQAARDPIPVEGVDPDTDEAYAYTVDDVALADLAFQSLYETYLASSWPAIVDDLDAGQTWSLDLLVSNTGDGIGTGDDVGVFYSVQCRDEWSYTTANDDPTDAFGEIDESNISAWPLLCGAWGAGEADPVEALSVEASVFPDAIPTMVIGGSLDPVTPREGALEVADDLGAAYVEFDQVGHGVLGRLPCAGDLAAAFLADPGAAVIDAAADGGACTGDHLSDTVFVSGPARFETVTVDLGRTTADLELPAWFDVGEDVGWFRMRDERLSDLTGLFVVPIDAVDEQTALDVVLPWFEGTPERTDRPDGTVWFTGATTEGVVIGPVSDQEVALIRFDEQTVVALALVTAVGELPVDRSVLETVAASVVAAS